MFPNVRLLIAAAFASVVMLICATGLFAAFRVSHEPLVHVRVDTAPLPPLAGEAATQPLAFAPAEPFGRRFDLGEPQRTGEPAEALTRWLARREGTDTPSGNPPAATDQAATPEVKEPATVEAPQEAAAPPSELPPPEPTIKIANAPANDDAPAAALPATAAPAAVNAEAPAESSPAATAEPPAALAPAEAPNVAALAPSADAIKPEMDVPPVAVSKPLAEPEKSKSATVKRKRHRVRRASSTLATQETTGQQTNFVTAPSSQQAQSWAKVRRTRLAPAKSGDATQTGGPFVSAPGQ